MREFGTFLETDYTRFDRSISLEALTNIQDCIFEHVFPEASHPLFHQALKLARTTNGKSSLGVGYSVEGTRCSGDAHTSIGNGLINAFNTYVCLRHLPNASWSSVHEGDDGIIGLESRYHRNALEGLSLLGPLGYNIKLDQYNQLCDVSFCGRHFYEEDGRLRDHADVLRSLDKMHTSVSGHRADALLLAKMMSYYSTDRDTPLIGPLTYHLIRALQGQVKKHCTARALEGATRERWATREYQLHVDDHRPPPNITWQARVSVARRTGITIDEQLWLESKYAACEWAQAPLRWPQITREWVTTLDGHIHGDPRMWVRGD